MTLVDLVDAVASGGLLAADRPVVVLLSGGRDSVCLLDVAARVCGSVTAVHVNYGLRAEAVDDERFCRELCAALGVSLDVRRVDWAGGPGNLQAWARVQRYRAAAQHPGDIAAGHTATDQVETILYRLASSPSRRALLGMRPREGRVVRPLLGFTREQTAAHCRARRLGWREDSTNESDAYARGRVRHGLVPALRAVHPAAEANVLALAEILRQEAEVLDGLVDGVLAERREVGLAELRALAPALRRLVVQRLADAAAGRPAAGVGRRADEVAALREGAELHLPSGIRATVHGGVVRLAAGDGTRDRGNAPGAAPP